jgi:SGNH hydrolase-like domain, acetyltransferase AlgX
MNAGRRYLAAAILAPLLIPSLGMVVAPYETQSTSERRALAPPPGLPSGARGWALLPRQVDRWFSDHFAWREILVKQSFTLQARAGLSPEGGQQVVRGQDDWLLLYAGLLTETGGEVHPSVAKRYAGFVCALQTEVRARGARFLFAPAPSTVEVYPEALPDWVPRGAPTQPDMVLADARQCGVEPLDLRPAMLAAKPAEKLYQHHDSHWTNAGALVAFNGVAQALGQPWAIDPKAMNWRPGRAVDSDLVRLGGDFSLPAELSPEPPEGPDGAPAEADRFKDLGVSPYPAPFVEAGRTPRPLVLIIGDSYTADFMGQYFRRAGVSWAWSHQAECRFDHRIFDRVKPDFVILAPASRLESCR